MDRRRFLAVTCVATMAGVGGCLADGDGDGGAAPTTQTPTADPTTTPDRPGTTDGTDAPGTTQRPSASRSAADVPDPDLPVVLYNQDRESHVVAVTVRRESGETVHEGAYEVGGGSEREVYNLRAAAPDGIETFEVTASMGDQSGTVVVETSACYGTVLVRVTQDGVLSPTFSIC